MGFSLSGFVGGFSQGVTQEIQEQEERTQRLEEIAREEASRLRIARAGERRKEKAVADALAGQLSLYFNPNEVEAIMSKGVGAGKGILDLAPTALENGVDLRTLVNLPSIEGEGELTEKDKDTINKTIEMGEPKDIGGLSTSADTTVPTTSGLLNLTAIADMYDKPDKIETTFANRLAVISQELARDPEGKNIDIAALKAEQTQLLEDLGKMKEAERGKSGDGKTTESFTPTAVSTYVREVRAGALTSSGFKLDTEGRIQNLREGNQHMAAIADIRVATELSERNSVIQSPLLEKAASAIHASARSDLQDHAFSTQNPIMVSSPEEYVKNFYTYRKGSVVSDGKFLYVKTGYSDPYNVDSEGNSMPFFKFKIGG